MTYKISILLLFSFFFTSAQKDFKSGYFIADGIKTDCLIENKFWNSSPDEFVYKLDKDSPTKTRNKFNTSEFGLNGYFKFISADVDIDESKWETDNLDYNREPEFEKKRVFLRLIIDSEVKFYNYTRGKNIKRYFYQIGNSDIEQLVYKKYLIRDKNKQIGENDAYKQWLFNNLKCEDQSLNDVEKLKYNETSLKKYFIEYNECIGAEIKFIDKKQKVDFLKYLDFSFSLKGGVEFGSTKVVNALRENLNTDLGSSEAFRYGVEAEFYLPFLKKQFSFYSDPSYRSISISLSIPDERLTGNLKNVNYNYSSFEIPLGIRYYYYFNEATQLFLNYAYVFDNVGDDSSVEFSRADGTSLGGFSNLKTNESQYFGVGLRAFDRFSGELRFYTNKDIGPNIEYSNSITLVVGYKVF
jgi:hypothetical protein